jgi:hypothetical protein
MLPIAEYLTGITVLHLCSTYPRRPSTPILFPLLRTISTSPRRSISQRRLNAVPLTCDHSPEEGSVVELAYEKYDP